MVTTSDRRHYPLTLPVSPWAKLGANPQGGLGPTMGAHDYEAMAAALEATGDYRILRRLQHRQHLLPYDGSPTRLGIFLDLETTGLDPAKSEIIELAMLPFTYSLEGRIFEVRGAVPGIASALHPDTSGDHQADGHHGRNGGGQVHRPC